MKKKSTFSATISISLFFIFFNSFSNAEAENLEFSTIRVAGSGCTSENTQIIMSADYSLASILFQTFESHVPSIITNIKTIPSFSQLNCNVFVDLKLPTNFKLKSLEISYDMRGHTFLERGVIGNFKSYLISSNGRETERTQRAQLLQEKSWINSNNDQEEDFLIRSTKSISIHSNCGRGKGSDIVSIHLQHQLASQILEAYKNTRTSGTITVDSSDMQGGIRLKAYAEACKSDEHLENSRNPRNNCRPQRINGGTRMVCE
jgi:hypothetical protein